MNNTSQTLATQGTISYRAWACHADYPHAIFQGLKPRPKKSKPIRQNVRDRPLTGINSVEPVSAPISPRHKWVFRVLAGIIIPFVALVLLEMALRIFGYGYPTGFFKPLRIGDQKFLVQNDSFGFRFFPPDIARMPASLRMPATKAPGTYRIFILGESAALGDPEPAFGAGRYLEMLLRDRFPKAKFEVINVAMTAINSHAIVPIARDCARQHGDFWILYLGNNEMVGPFGAATVFGSQAPPWELVRFNLAIQKLCLGQLLVAAGRELKKTTSDRASWNGMQMFTGNLVPPDDPRKEVVYRNFKRNLRDILRVGLDSGAHILLSTMAVNLKDCPPFASLISSNLDAGDRDRVEHLLNNGNSLAGQGDYANAIKLYEQAAGFRPQSAELEFRWASCLLQLADIPAAQAHFQKALDLDCLPFRADTRINTLISEAGKQLVSPRLSLFNAMAALGNGITNNILGEENFYEHVHLNFDGNYRLGRAWAGQVASWLPATFKEGASETWDSQKTCERRLGLTDWDRCNVLTEVCRRLQQPPLNGQLNNTQRLQPFLKYADELRRKMNNDHTAEQAHEIYAQALLESPDDYDILENFAYFLADRGDINGAIEQWQKVRDLIPQDHASYYELGRLAGQQGKFESAKSLFSEAVTIHPSFAPGWFELGKAQAATGNYEQAVISFGQALKFEPQDAQCWFDSGLAFALLNRRDKAIQYYRQAIRFAPKDWKAHYELGGLLGLDGKFSEARAESAIAVRLNPDFPVAHLNLGMALVQLGQLDGAEFQFQETLRLDPTNSKAADYLNQIRTLKNQSR